MHSESHNCMHGICAGSTAAVWVCSGPCRLPKGSSSSLPPEACNAFGKMGSPIVDAWLKNPILANRASVGRLSMICKDHLSRSDIVVNAQVLIPIIRFLGLRPNIDAITAEVERFFLLGRPAGKPAIKRFLVKPLQGSFLLAKSQTL